MFIVRFFTYFLVIFTYLFQFSKYDYGFSEYYRQNWTEKYVYIQESIYNKVPISSTQRFLKNFSSNLAEEITFFPLFMLRIQFSVMKHILKLKTNSHFTVKFLQRCKHSISSYLINHHIGSQEIWTTNYSRVVLLFQLNQCI